MAIVVLSSHSFYQVDFILIASEVTRFHICMLQGICCTVLQDLDLSSLIFSLGIVAAYLFKNCCDGPIVAKLDLKNFLEPLRWPLVSVTFGGYRITPDLMISDLHYRHVKDVAMILLLYAN